MTGNRLQFGIVDPLKDFPELQMAFVDENEIERGDGAPGKSLLRTDLKGRGCVGVAVLSLDDSDVWNSRLAERPYRLLDQVQTRHPKTDAGSGLDVFFLQDEFGREPGFAAPGRNFDDDPGFASVEGFVDLGDGGGLMIPQGRQRRGAFRSFASFKVPLGTQRARFDGEEGLAHGASPACWRMALSLSASAAIKSRASRSRQRQCAFRRRSA
jgi:hypothetical protein